MPGRVFDIAAGVQLPGRAIIDSSAIIDWLQGAYLSAPGVTQLSTRQQQAIQLIGQMSANNTIGLVTSVSFSEIFHFVIRAKFKSEIPNHFDDLIARYPSRSRFDWIHLYKARSDLLKSFEPHFRQLHVFLAAGGLLFLQPDDLFSIPSGKSADEEMLDIIIRYELDTSDAAILLEASRAGIRSIVTSDGDLLRAHLDFDVYTWL